MPYISMKELRTIDKYLTKQCSMNLVSNMSKEEAEQEIKEYCEVVEIFMHLYGENDKLIEKAKEGMKKYRANNPEKVKTYNREYMRKYNKRRKEAK